jgi:hypothetical protein
MAWRDNPPAARNAVPAPHGAGLAPRDAGLTPHGTRLAPHDAGLAPRNAGLAPHGAGLAAHGARRLVFPGGGFFSYCAAPPLLWYVLDVQRDVATHRAGKVTSRL